MTISQDRLGNFGMGLMGSAVMQRTGAACGWNVDASRYVKAVSAGDLCDHLRDVSDDLTDA